MNPVTSRRVGYTALRTGWNYMALRVVCGCGACREIEPETHRRASGSNVLEKTGTIDARDNCSGVTR